MKIAICDDESKICLQLKNILDDILPTKVTTNHIDTFNSGETLCKKLQDVEYGLVFVDIELPEMSGVEIGQYIRETRRDNITQIAYISSKQEYAMELFDTRPINFLVKPLDREKVTKVIDAYLKISVGKYEVIRFKKGHEQHRIVASKIMYFERDGRKVRMFTTDETIEFYESLEKIYEQIKSFGFLQIHKSYVVNNKYVRKISYKSLQMTNGETLPISQSHRNEVRAAYMQLGGE